MSYNALMRAAALISSTRQSGSSEFDSVDMNSGQEEREERKVKLLSTRVEFLRLWLPQEHESVKKLMKLRMLRAEEEGTLPYTLPFRLPSIPESGVPGRLMLVLRPSRADCGSRWRLLKGLVKMRMVAFSFTARLLPVGDATSSVSVSVKPSRRCLNGRQWRFPRLSRPSAHSPLSVYDGSLS